MRAFPADQHFIENLRAAAAALATMTGDDDERREALEVTLRRSYPLVEVRVREELAGMSTTDRLWYALRDGRVEIDAAASGEGTSD